MKTQNMISLLGGAVVGAAAMYLLDPEMGQRRRKNVKQHAGEYLGDTGEMLHSGWEKVSEGARNLGSTIAEKAQDYGQRLSHQAQDIGSDISDQTSGWLGRGRKWLGDHVNKAHDYVPSNRQIRHELSDYSKGLWDRARSARRKVQDRFSDKEWSAVLPVTLTALGCCALGAGVMFVTDPRLGRSRRAWLMDKATSIFHRTGRSFYRTGKDFANRAYGTAAHAQSAWQSHEAPSSQQLHERVRSAMGRAISYPRLVQIMAAANGAVTVSGCALGSEVDRLISTIEDVPGVTLVINRLERLDSPEELQRRSNRQQSEGVAQL